MGCGGSKNKVNQPIQKNEGNYGELDDSEDSAYDGTDFYEKIKDLKLDEEPEVNFY